MNAKKVITGAVILAVAVTAAFSAPKKKNRDWYNSYGRQVREGNILLNAGVGLDGQIGEDNLHSYIPPLELSVEYVYPLADLPFGFGAFVGYSSYGTKWSLLGTTSEVDTSDFYTGVMVNYHFNLVDELDLYGSVKTGLEIETIKEKTTGIPDSTERSGWFYYGMAAGATYYFNDTFGVNAEVGFPTILRVAASFKFSL